MQEPFETMVLQAMRTGAAAAQAVSGPHPDEESLALLAEGKLLPSELAPVVAHVAQCRACARVLAVCLAGEVAEYPKEMPPQLVQAAKQLAAEPAPEAPFEIVLKFAGDLIEIVRAAGDVMVGEEVVPVPVLRSRKIEGFKDEISILKDIKNVRLDVKIRNQQGGQANIAVLVLDKSTARPLRDVRVTLCRGGVDLESYQCDDGAACFEGIAVGAYTVKITEKDATIISLLIDIRT